MGRILENHCLHIINEDKTNDKLIGVMIQVNESESVFSVNEKLTNIHNAETNLQVRYAIMGFIFNDLWKLPVLLQDSDIGLDELITTDRWEKAKIFEKIHLAENQRKHLQTQYNNYTWYVVCVNGC